MVNKPKQSVFGSVTNVLWYGNNTAKEPVSQNRLEEEFNGESITSIDDCNQIVYKISQSLVSDKQRLQRWLAGI